MPRTKKEILEDEKCKDICGHLEAAYELSTELTAASGVIPSDRENISLGLHIMRDNVMETLGCREVSG